MDGMGAVSPAGWGVLPLRKALVKGEPLAIKELARPGWSRPLRGRPVSAPSPRPAFMAHPRLRRASPVTQYAIAAALEALGDDVAQVGRGSVRLGIVICVMSGCVNYSRRFYDETLKDPTTASPVVFPETVFNSPASHLAALLGTAAINYTIVGDPGSFLQGVALAADWLQSDRVDRCLVVGAEEIDWLTTEAFRIFDRKAVVSDGAGALYLRRESINGRAVRLEAITQAHSFSKKQTRAQAAVRARKELGGGGEKSLLCDSLQDVPRLDGAESTCRQGWCGS